jgi:hypothetical protein
MTAGDRIANGSLESPGVCALFLLVKPDADPDDIYERTRNNGMTNDPEIGNVLIRECALSGCKGWFEMKQVAGDVFPHPDAKHTAIVGCIKLPTGVIR